jgi:hypothetical protein
MASEQYVSFVSSRVEWFDHVIKATIIYPHRLDLRTDQGTKVIRFADIAEWPRPRWF